MCQNINIGNFQYSQDDKGNWIYKAIDVKKVNKKASYKDVPQYKAIQTFEDQYKNEYKLILDQAIKEINQYLNDL